MAHLTPTYYGQQQPGDDDGENVPRLSYKVIFDICWFLI